MRIAYIASRIGSRSELDRAPIDAEWLLATPHDLSVYVDEESIGANLVRDRFPVYVAAKQRVDLGGEIVGSSDRAQAATLVAHHLDDPFDALLYDSDRAIDWAVYEPALAGVRRGVCLGRGAPAYRAMIRTSPEVAQQFARSLWAEFSAIASADFLVAHAPAESFGLIGYEGLVVTPDVPVATVERENAGGTIAVVAMYGDVRTYAELVADVRSTIAIADDATVVVIVPEWSVGTDTVAGLVQRSVKPEWALSTVVVTGPGSAAAEFIRRADLVVAASPPDLGVSAVREAASHGRVVSLTGATETLAPLESIGELPIPEPLSVEIVAFEEIDSLRSTVAHVDYVFVTGPGGTQLAEQASQLSLASRDLVVFGIPQPVTGHPDPGKLSPAVIGFSSAQWPSVEPLVGKVRSVWELIVWMARVSNASFTRLEVLPAPIGATSHDLTIDIVPGLPAFTNGRPPLETMDLSQSVRPVAAPPAKLAPKVSVQSWAKEHSWADRARLVLPWRYGLLPKAMRDRW